MISLNPNAIELIEKNLDKINWKYLAQNPSAIELLEENLDKIEFNSFIAENPNAVHIIEKNLDKLDKLGWHSLSSNPNAIHILEKFRQSKLGLFIWKPKCYTNT